MIEISLYEVCALIAVSCFVVITVFLVKLLSKATKTLDGVDETNKKVKEIVTNVNDAVSLANPLISTMKDAKKILEQLRNVVGGFKGKKQEIVSVEENKQTQKANKRKRNR